MLIKKDKVHITQSAEKIKCNFGGVFVDSEFNIVNNTMMLKILNLIRPINFPIVPFPNFPTGGNCREKGKSVPAATCVLNQLAKALINHSSLTTMMFLSRFFLAVLFPTKPVITIHKHALFLI